MLGCGWYGGGYCWLCDIIVMVVDLEVEIGS